MRDHTRYHDVDAITLRLEVDDPIGMGNNFPEQYTWRLKGYEDGVTDGEALINRDIIGEMLEDDKNDHEDYPQFKDTRMFEREKSDEDVFQKEVPISDESGDREIPTNDPHRIYKQAARAAARDQAIELRTEYEDININIDGQSFYNPEFDF